MAFHFVSNARCDELTPENGDQRRRGRCPKHILEHVRLAASPSTISEPFRTVFGRFQAECGCNTEELFSVLRKVDIVHGPSREDIDASVSNEHLGTLSGFNALVPRALDDARDELVAIVHRASSLQVTDPARHLRGLLDQISAIPHFPQSGLWSRKRSSYVRRRAASQSLCLRTNPFWRWTAKYRKAPS